MKNNKIDRRSLNMEQMKEYLPLSYFDKAFVWLTGAGGILVNYVSNDMRRDALALILLMIIDFATGIKNGAKKKEINSKVMSIGIAKKAGMIALIISANILDRLIIPGDSLFTTFIIYMLIGYEFTSITENLSRLGVPIPKFITNVLGEFKKIGDVENISDVLDIVNGILNIKKGSKIDKELEGKLNKVIEFIEKIDDDMADEDKELNEIKEEDING